MIDVGVIDTLSTWEELADAGRVLASDLDAGRFSLGDVGLRCETVYGANSLGQLAADIGLARANTLRQYTRVSRRFDPVSRGTFLDAGLNWSHFRESMRAGADAELWLARAADEGWNVSELHRQIATAIGKPVPPRLLLDCEAVVLDCDGGHVTLYIEAAHELAYRQRVTVRVYAAQAEGVGA